MTYRPSFKDITDEMQELQESKGKDYGGEGDPLGNICDSIHFGIEPWVGAILRANDKMARLKTFIRVGRLENESVEDSIKDLAVYAIHALRLYRESICRKRESINHPNQKEPR